MDRYGAPHFRGSSAQGYPVRQPPSRSGLLGPVPTRANPPAQARPQPQSILKNSRQTDWQGARPATTGRDGILGAPPKPPSRDSYTGRPPTWDDRHVKPTDGRKSDEVSQLMKSLGLSQSDIQKLSQMPEHEINVNNLARAIGDLKKGQSPQFPKDRSSAYDPAQPTSDYDYNRRGSSYQSDSRAPYQRSDTGLVREPPYSRGDTTSYNAPTSSGFKSAGPPRNQPLPRKQASIPDNDSYGNGRNVERRRDRARDDDDYHSRDERDRYTHSSSEQYSQGRNETFRTKRIVEEINDDRQGHESNYGRQQRVDNSKKAQPQRSAANASRPAPRGLLRGPDSRSSQSSLLNPPEKRGRWERGSGTSAGLLGNPLQPNAQGLNSLAAAVGRSPQSSLSVTQAASTVLNPLLLAGQTDPAVLEVQLQAIKVLQAEALKQQPASSSAPSFDSRNSSKPRQTRQSYPPSDRLDRREEENRRNAKKEADEMRAMQGRVLYMRFKSNRILEADLKQLAAAFGRVTNILIIRAKIPNGFNQAFMEMEQYDCAAAMVEHYKAKPPIVCGCSVLVDRSNYRDLQLRINQPDRKRERSISPIRKGTTQLPSKRLRDNRFDDKPRLNVSVSDNRRLVTHTPGKTPPKDAKTDSKNDNRRREPRSSSTDRQKKSSRSKTPEKRRTSDRRRPNSAQKTNAKENNKKEEIKTEKDGAAKEKPAEEQVEKKKDANEEAKVEKKNAEQTEKAKDTIVEADPLDVIADELALHDDFSIMDDYNNDEDQDKEAVVKQDETKEAKEQPKEGKEATTDLDGGDLDLEDVNVDVSQDEEEVQTEKDVQDPKEEGTTETDAVPIPEEDDLKIDDTKEDKDESKTETDGQDIITEADAAPLVDDMKQEVDDTGDKDDEVDAKADEIQVKEEEQVEDVVEVNESQTDDSQDDIDTSITGPQESQDEIPPTEEEGEEDANQDQEESQQAPSANDDQADEVARLKFIITSALQEVNNARDQLVALNKTTKNRATVAVSKKLKLCLDGAVTRLEGAEEA